MGRANDFCVYLKSRKIELVVLGIVIVVTGCALLMSNVDTNTIAFMNANYTGMIAMA